MIPKILHEKGSVHENIMERVFARIGWMKADKNFSIFFRVIFSVLTGLSIVHVRFEKCYGCCIV